jgi:hypothetical protein
MAFDELSPEEKEIWNELKRDLPWWECLDSGDVAELCRLVVKEDNGTIGEDEECQLFDLYIKCGMTPLSRRKFEQPGPEFKPN